MDHLCRQIYAFVAANVRGKKCTPALPRSKTMKSSWEIDLGLQIPL